MSLLNRLMGRGTPTNQSDEYAEHPNASARHEQPAKHESQFMQAGRTGYQGAVDVEYYDVRAATGSEQQGLAQTEGGNHFDAKRHGMTAPTDAQQAGVNRQHYGSAPQNSANAFQSRSAGVQEPLTEQRGSQEGVGRQHDITGVLTEAGSTTYSTQTQPRSRSRSPRKDGIGSKVKRMFSGNVSRSERNGEGYNEGGFASSQDTMATAPGVAHTRDDTAALNTSSPMTTHSDSVGGLSPRGNWNPTEGFAFRKSTTPPPHLNQRDEKAALAVAKHDGQMPTSGYDTPPEELSAYEGGGYDNYGDNAPGMHDVPHSKPGRYASRDQGGAWGDHRASEVGSFRGSGMHSPSKRRLGDSERPSWVAPGTSQSDPAITAAAAAGGAAAARAVSGGHSDRREGQNLSQERRGFSREPTALQGAHGPGRSDSGFIGFDLSEGGVIRSRRTDSGVNRFDRSDSGVNRFDRSDSGVNPARRNSLDVAQGIPTEQGINQYDRSDSGVNRFNRADGGISRSVRVEGPRGDSRDQGFNQYDRADSGMNRYERSDSGVNRSSRSDSSIDRSVCSDGGVIQARPAKRAISPTKQSGLAVGAGMGSGMTNRAEPASDIRDYYKSEGGHSGSETTLEPEPFGSGQDIGYNHQEGVSHGGVGQQFDNMTLNEGQTRQGVPLRSTSGSRDVGLQAGGQDFGFEKQGYKESGYGNEGSLDRAYSGNNRNQEGYQEGYDNSGTKLGGKPGFGTQEAVHHNRGTYNQNLQHPVSQPAGQQIYADQVGFDEGFRNHGQTTQSKAGYEEGFGSPDHLHSPEDLRRQSMESQDYPNQDVTDTQTGAQNYGVGGRTEAETPYQLGERISDERLNVRGYDSVGNQSPRREQSFGLGGATTAQTPYELGQKISDKAWNEKSGAGISSDTVNRSAYENRDVTNSQTEATTNRSGYDNRSHVIDSQTGAQNYGVGGRSEAETPYQLGEGISDKHSHVPGYNSTTSGSPNAEQSFGLGGATTAQTPYGLGETISDKSWNDKHTTGHKNDNFEQSGLGSGALGAGAIGMGMGAMEAKRMHGGTASEFQRSTSTCEPIMDRESEVALGKGKVAETPGAAAAATQHARTEQSDLDSSYVKEGAPGGPQSEMQGGMSGMQEPPVSPRSQQYLQHGEPAKSPGLLTSAKYALGRAQNKLTNTHHHLTAGGGNISSVTGVAFGKLDLVAKRMLHGGEHLWREAFHPPPEEHLRKSFACLLSTETGAVAGVLYQSDHSLYFCSDRALQRAVKAAETHVAAPPAYEQYMYKVVLPLADVAHVESRASERSERDKSIKVEMSGGEQFWFFGFVTFEKALVNLQHAKEVHGLRSASMSARGA